MAGTDLATRRKQEMNAFLGSKNVMKRFEEVLDKNAGSFVASIADLYASEAALQKCEPKAVVMECLKAAALKLPISKQLGFAYIVPFKNVPTFIPGYRGYIQLALRTGQYRYLNADIVRDGQSVVSDFLTGNVEITGEPKKKNAKAIGYFAYLELMNGFRKTVYMTHEDVIEFAKAKSPSYKVKTSAWHTDTEAMCLKTVVRKLLTKYGIMSVEMASAVASDLHADSPEDQIAANANQGEELTIPADDAGEEEAEFEETDNAVLDAQAAAEEKAKPDKKAVKEEEEPLPPDPDF